MFFDEVMVLDNKIDQISRVNESLLHPWSWSGMN